MSRRTRWVRAGQAALLLVWLGCTLRPVSGRNPAVLLFDPPNSGYTLDMIQLGDPLPWASVVVSGDTSEFLYPPDGRPGRPSVVPNPNRQLKREWGVIDPFAPLPGLLLALALPPLLADRLSGRRRWNRWQLVATAAGAGGLLAGVLWTVVFSGGHQGLIGWLERAAKGETVRWLHDTTFRDALMVRWKLGLEPGTVFGLTVVGLAAAGALRPWRPAPPLQPHLPAEQPPPAGNTPL